jgi:processive 1,2-diacylglycerol beta-glucosyltransferase
MPRYLILHVSVGNGHRSAANALADAFERLPDSEVRVEDALDYASPIFSTAYSRSYLELSQRATPTGRRFVIACAGWWPSWRSPGSKI